MSVRERKWNALVILNILMSSDKYLTTNEICRMADCERKTVYNVMDILEINGFGIDIISPNNPKEQNRYKYIGLYGA